MSSAVHFFNEDTSPRLDNKRLLKKWLELCIRNEKQIPEDLNIIFCSDEYLAEMNLQFLKHNTYTDIITFDHSEQKGYIRGDIFISTDRVKENAGLFETAYRTELCRVMIHGTLHLLGYGDKTEAEKKTMRMKEDEYLLFLEELKSTKG